MKTLLTALALSAAATTAGAASLNIATWNLGWHLDAATAKTWIAACSRPFALQDGIWKPVAQAGEGTQTGWALPWGRNAPVEWDIGQLPPCNVFEAPAPAGVSTASGRIVPPITEAGYAQRSARIAQFLRESVQADVIAFQEVSGAQAVRELLGEGWKVCSYEGHKVQRTAIAWKASLGEGSCRVHWPLALPDKPMKEQVRPGLALTLTQEGKTLSVLTLHLKSSCVSPLDDQNRTPGRGQLEGNEPNCLQLQAQVAPLEAWLDAELKTADALVMLGDFNRNLAHEASEPADRPARVDGRTRNLWRELNDGEPAALSLLGAQCAPAADGRALCSLAKERLLSGPEYGALRQQLGCRNPIGLDHVVLAGRAQAPAGAQKIALGALAETRADGQLGLSDHCPVRAQLEFPR